MSLAADRHASSMDSECWCCGSTFPPAQLIRLGQHPEVGLCVACVGDLRRRAHLNQTAKLTKPIYQLGEQARSAVVARGWHRAPVIGALLRGVGRLSPW